MLKANLDGRDFSQGPDGSHEKWGVPPYAIR